MFNIAWFKTKDKNQYDKIIEMLTMIYDRHNKDNDENLLNRVSEFTSKDNMNPEERKNYVADVSVVFEKVLKPKIEKLIFQQKEYIASKGLKDEFEFDRGTMNGILTVFEEFERDHLEHLDNVKPKEEFDKYEVMNELLK
jgi:hypothetical protein